MGLFTLDKDLLPENWKKSRPSGKPVLWEPPEVGSREPVYLVTDTSWWMEQGWRDGVEITETSPDILFVIPAGTMRELDGLKYNESKAERAREATKQIFELIQKKKAKIVKGKNSIEGFLSSPVDEEVLSVAKNLKKRAETVLLTTDYAMMAIAENEGIKNRKYWKTNFAINNTFQKRKSSYYVKFIILFIFIYFLGIITSSVGLFFLGIVGSIISFIKWWKAPVSQGSGSFEYVTSSDKKDNKKKNITFDETFDDLAFDPTSLDASSGFDPLSTD